jgi:methylated-DNA-[protein]-cysteine S-methyltransferase
MTEYCLFDTAIGTCGIAWNEHGLTRLQLPERDPSATGQRLRANTAGASGNAPAAIAQVVTNVQRYMQGESIDFSAVVIDLAQIEPFGRKVYEAARAVRWGQTQSYGALARQIGAPGAARAVGRALSRNPVPIIIPCHRILAKGHRVGGFSAYGGTLTKERLLALEAFASIVARRCCRGSVGTGCVGWVEGIRVFTPVFAGYTNPATTVPT